MPSTRHLTIAFAASRIAFGAGLIAAPGTVAGRWLGKDAAREPVKVALRGLGARDIALSAGALAALDDPDQLAVLLGVTIASDLTDLAATLAVPAGQLPDNARVGTVVLAGAGAAVGAALLAAVKR